MKQLITAVILTATAITAQAKNISLDCTFTNVNGGVGTMSFLFDPELKTGIIPGQPPGVGSLVVNTSVSEYTLVGITEMPFTINRETLALMINKKLPGQCEISKNNNKI
jgi:hypothetical protein